MKITIYILTFLLSTSAYAQGAKTEGFDVLAGLKETKRDQRLDYEMYKSINYVQGSVYTDKDSTRYRMLSDFNGYTEWEMPHKKFYTIQRHYRPNGEIASRVYYLTTWATQIGIMKYNEEYMGEKTHNSDQQYDAFGYNDVILFLHKKGFVNKDTTKGWENIVMSYSKEKCRWYVTTQLDRYKEFGYVYVLDGNTGKILQETHHEKDIK